MKRTPFLLFYFLLVVNSISAADNVVSSAPAKDRVIEIPDAIKELNLSDAIQVLEESNQPYRVEEILSGKFDSLFHENQIAETKEWNRSVWTRIEIKSGADKITSWILQTDKLYDVVDCYIVFPDGKVLKQRSGWSLAPAERSVKDADVIFNLSLAQHQSAEIYLHINTNLHWSSLDCVEAKLVSAEQVGNNKWKVYSFLLFYTGICILAAFYWILTYFYSLRLNYLYLVAATSSTLIIYLDHFGIFTNFFLCYAPWYYLSKYGQTFLWLPVFSISNYALTGKLNHFGKNFPRLIFLFWTYAAIFILVCVFSPILFTWKFAHALIFIMLGFGTWLPTIFLFYSWLKKENKSAGFSLIASLPFIIGVDFFAASSLEIIPDNFSISMIGPAGGLITVILFFYGMVTYVTAIRRKREEEHVENERLIREQNTMLEQNVAERTRELEIEKEKANELLRKSDELLLNILPVETANELKLHGRSKAKTYGMVTVMFMDFKNFTEISEKVSPELLVSEIDYCFSAFDNIIQKHGIEKIKTIGDAYISAGGLPVLNYTHAADTIYAAIEIRKFILQRKTEKEAKGEIPFELRIGIHTGPVVAGIVGVKKFAYDIWGDTVNIAARMESSGEAGKINISGVTYQLVKDLNDSKGGKFNFAHRGKIKAKNKGEIDMYFVEELSNINFFQLQ